MMMTEIVRSSRLRLHVSEKTIAKTENTGRGNITCIGPRFPKEEIASPYGGP
jgi:hypothetical protein